MVKRVGKYEIGKTLGEGTFGKVKYAINTETGEKVAIKVLDKEKIQKQNMGNQIKKEISIMKMVKHENVVKLYEVLASRTKIFIVLELITGGELFDKIVAEGRFDENTARFYFRQLIKGLKYCHAQGVCHRDLKPENLLLDVNANLKISDFGLSALYSGSADDEGRATLLHTTCGTPNYVAPEVLADKGYDGRAADVWSCGVILYVLLAGFLPFDEPHMSALFRKIQKAEYSFPPWFSKPVRNLIARILVPNPADRYTVSDIENDPWFRGNDDYVDDGLPFSVTEKMRREKEHAEMNAKAPAMRHVPSARDIEEAVASVEEAPNGSPSASSPSRTVDGPRLLNAFDLVSMFGGLEISRLSDPVDKKTGVASDATTKAVIGLGSNPKSLRFISAAEYNVLLKRFEEALTSLGVDATTDSKAYKVRGRIQTSRGEISLNVLVYRMNDELHLVEVQKGRGDILEFNNLHQKFRGLIDDLVLKPTA